MADGTRTITVTKKDGTKTTIKVKEGKRVRVDARSNTKGNIRIYAKDTSDVVSAKTEGSSNGIVQETTTNNTNMSTEANQSIASREDLQREARQSLLLERRDYESAYMSSIPEREDGTIILPDTAREARIREANNKTTDYEEKISSSKISEKRVEERRNISQQNFLENPSLTTLRTFGNDLFAEGVSETIPAGIRTAGAFDLGTRGFGNIIKGTAIGEYKTGPTISLGVAQLSAARKELYKEPISAVPTLAVEIGAITVVSSAVLRGSSVAQQRFIPDKIPKVSTITDVSTGTTTTRTTSVGTVYDANVQTFFGRSVVTDGELTPIVRGNSVRGTIITEIVSTPNINRAGQVLETGVVESTTSFQRAGSKTPKIIQTTFGNQRGEVIDEIIFERNVKGGTRAVSYITSESVPTGTGSELFTVRGQTITGQGKRSGFLLQENKIVSDVGSTRTSIGNVRTIEYPDIKQPIIKNKISLGKKGQVAISSSGTESFSVVKPSFDIVPPKVVTAGPSFSNLGRAGIISEELAATRGIGGARISSSSFLGIKSLLGTNSLSSSIGANSVKTNSFSSPNTLNNVLGISTPQPIIESVSGSSANTTYIPELIGSSRSIGRLSRPNIPKPIIPIIPPIIPSINLGSGFSTGSSIRRYKGKSFSGTPPSLTGALLGIGVKTKKGSTYSGLETRR